MLTPKERVGAGGVRSWGVEWRLGGGRAGAIQSVTFSERHTDQARRLAQRAAQLVEAHRRQVTRVQVYEAILGTAATPTPDALTLDDWFDEWIELKTGAGDRTIQDYRDEWRRYVRGGPLGRLALALVDADDVAAWVRDLSAHPSRLGGTLAATTVQRAHSLVHQVLGAAVPKRIPANPASGTPLPSRHHGKIREERVFLTSDEAALVVGAFADSDAREFVEVLLGTGCRWGEATALQVGDDDQRLQPVRLSIQRAWKRGVLGSPKSVRSRRTITIDKHTAAILAARACRLHNREGALYFANTRAGALNHSNFMRRHWRPAVQLACGWDPDGLPVPRAPILTKEPTPHSCRHSHAAWLLTKGVPIARVSQRLGHESSTTTDRAYGHLVPSTDDDVLDAITVAMRRSA